jgi:hypothetical protein
MNPNQQKSKVIVPDLDYPFEPTDHPYWDCECFKDYIRPIVTIRFKKRGEKK